MQLSQRALVVEMEVCCDCHLHAWCSRHDETKYDSHFTAIKQKLTSEFPHVVVSRNAGQPGWKKVRSPASNEQNKYIDLETKQVITYPRLGAFEVRVNSKLVYSKLQAKMWPSLQAIVEQIRRLLRPGPSSRQPNLSKSPVGKQNCQPVEENIIAPDNRHNKILQLQHRVQNSCSQLVRIRRKKMKNKKVITEYEPTLPSSLRKSKPGRSLLLFSPYSKIWGVNRPEKFSQPRSPKPSRVNKSAVYNKNKYFHKSDEIVMASAHSSQRIGRKNYSNFYCRNKPSTSPKSFEFQNSQKQIDNDFIYETAKQQPRSRHHQAQQKYSRQDEINGWSHKDKSSGFMLASDVAPIGGTKIKKPSICNMIENNSSAADFGAHAGADSADQVDEDGQAEQSSCGLFDSSARSNNFQSAENEGQRQTQAKKASLGRNFSKKGQNLQFKKVNSEVEIAQSQTNQQTQPKFKKQFQSKEDYPSDRQGFLQQSNDFLDSSTEPAKNGESES